MWKLPKHTTYGLIYRTAKSKEIVWVQLERIFIEHVKCPE